MKADIELKTVNKVVEVVEKEVVLTLTEQEAQHLRALVGQIRGGSSYKEDSIRYTTDKMYEALESVGITKNIEITRQIKTLQLHDWY